MCRGKCLQSSGILASSQKPLPKTHHKTRDEAGDIWNMTTYVLIYHGGMPGPGEKEKSRCRWNAWLDSLGNAVIDPGNPFKKVDSVGQNGQISGTATNPITGYTVIKSEDVSSAVALTRNCPIFFEGGTLALAHVAIEPPSTLSST